MKAKSGSKWIDGLKTTTPIVDAAHHVLSVRLMAIAHDFPLGIEHADADLEHVHHLRVGTRRARAAVDTFSSCLRRHARKLARKWLRRIRRAAGAARDWDVFLTTLNELESKENARTAPGLKFLAGYAWCQRRSAQADLHRLAHSQFETPESIAECVLPTIRQPKDRKLRKLRDLASPRLRHTLEELQEAAGGELAEYEQLHRVRIAGKRLRYAMEIFGSCFARAFRTELYPAIEQMQDILGRANDSHVALGHLDALHLHMKSAHLTRRKTVRAGIDFVKRFHQRRLPQERRNFEDWWKQWQVKGYDAAFQELLRDV